MEPLKIELKDKNALSILKSLEKAKMIKVIRKEPSTRKSTVRLQDAPFPNKTGEIDHPVTTQKELRHFGFAKDAILLKPNFDDPMEDFKEYL